jgi:hypothetical protein
MSITRNLLSIGTVLTLSLISVGDPPKNPTSVDGLPVVGKWSVEFANGVRETCEVKSDGTSSVVEPLRSSPGKATVREKAVVIVSDDDRVERWTQVGRRMVVEHWFPASQFPAGTPVVGIADRAE